MGGGRGYEGASGFGFGVSGSNPRRKLGEQGFFNLVQPTIKGFKV